MQSCDKEKDEKLKNINNLVKAINDKLKTVEGAFGNMIKNIEGDIVDALRQKITMKYKKRNFNS